MNSKKEGLIRFITAGSVDDGKSTLIGRLLFDSKSILADQLSLISKAKNSRSNIDGIDLAFLTDGLESEREQGITIDVAYRYFSTKNKKFIIADCPGHEQYTRNMVTGASNADSAIFLVDATQVIDGNLLIQTKRHTLIACILRIPNFILAVNKMDLVDYDEKIFREIISSFDKLLNAVGMRKQFSGVPISALYGDNIVTKSSRMPWYKGNTLLDSLENNVNKRINSKHLRLPIQLSMRWDGEKKIDQRAYCGKVDSGQINVNQTIKIWPSNQNAKIIKITYLGSKVSQAHSGQCVTIWLDKDLDITRGDVIVSTNEFPNLSKEFKAEIAWLDVVNLNSSRKYRLRQATRETQVKVHVIDKLNLSSLRREPTETLSMNEIGKSVINSAQPVLKDNYEFFPNTGCFILIDETTHQTCAAGMIC
ncbi:MAG: hypothetical protein CBD16_06355 [Betaproteobacteria bacterium TMED156]|nr:MAG: hypothetical protein CBD16_06355 [Betaproteobacteria bacterium TMED156]